MEHEDADSPEARALAVTLGRRIHHNQSAAAELDTITEDLKRIADIFDADPAYYRLELIKLSDRLTALAQQLKNEPPAPPLASRAPGDGAC